MSARRRAHFSATLSNNSQLGLVSREDSEKNTEITSYITQP